MKLTSMVDYVIENTKPFETIDDRDYYHEILISYGKMKNYAKFLKQSLKLEMFVPCDDEGEPLEEPDFFSGEYDENGYGDVDKYQYKLDVKQYQKAQEKVLFKGFEVEESELGGCLLIYNGESYLLDSLFALSETIEGLLNYLSNIELTENAIKQLK